MHKACVLDEKEIFGEPQVLEGDCKAPVVRARNEGRRVSILDFSILTATVLVAACLQGAIGFGLGLVAAPVMAIVAPELFPVTIIILAAALTATSSIVDRAGIDFRGTGWALLGRIPGTVIGTILVVALPPRGLSSIIGVTVLIGVLFSVIGWRPKPRRLTVTLAGLVSGITGTATGIGGPPMALVWQQSAAAVYRGTMGTFFLVGTVVSLIALAISGSIEASSVRGALWLLPAVAVGYALSRLVAKYMDHQRLKRAAMIASVFGALGALILPAF
jgi:hypothetical protein